LILALALVGLVLGLTIPFGPIAWWLGSTDLARIRAGEMDPEGESLTRVGQILGMVQTILTAIAILGVCLIVALIASLS
jgi:hypothetical protein